jgi:23S rRNA (cytosine1962-C5)-methyltransferase
MASLILKPGRERSLQRRHPWIFSGAVDRIEGDPGPGETVDLFSSRGDFLARAAYSPQSQIRARVWTFENERVDEDFFQSRIHLALQARDMWNLASCTDAYRLIFAESERLPGLIVDRYGDVLVLQSLTAGSEQWKDTFADILLKQTGLHTIYERSDADVRALEGLAPCVGLLRGKMPAMKLTIHETTSRFIVDLLAGQKTGFYLDQRVNRKHVLELAEGRDVLDCFCYTGSFTVNALAGGAKSVVAVDTSAEALAFGSENLALNGHELKRVEWIEGDVFQTLRRFRDEGRSYDMIILDPPKFAPTAAHAEKAARGYKDINRLAFLLLRPGGLLVTFSCSGGVDAALFQKIVASAALDAGVEAQIVGVMTQGPDHPVLLQFPEGAYLKGLVCLVN